MPPVAAASSRQHQDTKHHPPPTAHNWVCKGTLQRHSLLESVRDMPPVVQCGPACSRVVALTCGAPTERRRDLHENRIPARAQQRLVQAMLRSRVPCSGALGLVHPTRKLGVIKPSNLWSFGPFFPLTTGLMYLVLSTLLGAFIRMVRSQLQINENR